MATSSHLRLINQRKIVRTMLRHSHASRTRLAQLAGMSQATVGRIVDDLIKESILAEVANGAAPATEAPPQLGRPIQLLELDRNRLRFLLIQLGVRQTRVAAVPLAIPAAENWPVEFATPGTTEGWAESLRQACKEIPLDAIESVVLSCPGVIDERAGSVLLCPNLRWAERFDFSSTIQTIVSAPVHFVQEIRALALGQLAAEPDLEDFLLVDFGDGLGAASVISSKLQAGHIPLSGELGHTPVLHNKRRCGCGSVGCIETLVSRRGLLKSFSDRGGSRSWKALLASLQEHGIPRWLRISLDAAAINVAGALNVEGIQNVLFTGTVTEFPTEVTDYLATQVRKDSMWARLGTVTCNTAPRRRMAGMISTGIERALFSAET